MIMGDTNSASQNGSADGKKQILLNAFDMSTVGHLSPGQWRVSPMIKVVECMLITT
jgi:hypothetical protein